MRPRGLLSLELAQSLVVAVVLFVVLVPPLLRWANHTRDVTHLNAAIADIHKAAEHHYAEAMLTTRCLAAPSLTLTALGLTLPDLGIGFDVQYRLGPRGAPTGIVVRLTPRTDAGREVLRRLTPDAIEGATHEHHAPMAFTLPDWQDLNLATGCIR